MSVTAPKKAVILAAGFGSRLRPLTDLRPKPLVEVNGVPILHNALRQLEAIGVKDVTIVVGYRKDAIEYSCGSRFGGLDISYVESSVFEKTGSAYSLWLARQSLLQGDCYLLEGDVFFELDALQALANAEAENVAAVAPFDVSMEGSAVLLADNGYIAEFRMKQRVENVLDGMPRLFKTMNLLRLSGADLRTKIVPYLDDLIASGAVKAYTEELFANLIERRGLRLMAARCDTLRWYEIDCADDLKMAEAIFAMGDQIGKASQAAPSQFAMAVGE
jgi:NDP-sugar pyrophosphorylase family protein